MSTNTNTNTETGVAYGVVNGNAHQWLMEDIFENGRNLTWEAYVSECTLPEDEIGEDYYCEEEEYEYEDSNGNQFLLGYLGGAPLVWCIKTDRVVTARPCSPCVPGAGDLDNLDDGGIQCYGVPSEYESTE